MTRDRVGHHSRQPDVVGNHPAIPGGADLPQRQPDLERAEAARVLRPVVDVVRGLLVEVIVRRVIRERTRAAVPDRARARSRLRAGRRATCADRRPPNPPGSARADRPTRRGRAAAKPPYAPSTWNHTSCVPADARRSRAADRPRRCSPSRRAHDHDTGRRPRRASASICRRSAATSMRRCASVGIQRIESVPRPARSAAFCIHVCVSAEAYTRKRAPGAAGDALRAHVPAGLRRARRQEADDVRHVAAARRAARRSRSGSRSARRSSARSAPRFQSRRATASTRRRSD